MTKNNAFAIFLIIASFAVLTLFGCGKKADNTVKDNKESNRAVSSEIIEDSKAVITSTPLTEETDSDGSTHIVSQSCQTMPSANNALNDKGVIVMKIYQNNFPDPLSDTEANEIRNIIGKYSMNTHSWDNLPDYTIIIDGTYYSYETSSGIITRDDTHADKLSEADKNVINKIIKATEKQSSTVVKETVAATVGHPATITNCFVIKEVNGTNLIMARYESGTGELKDGLYSGNYGNLDGSADMQFNVGDIVTVRYDYDIQETYPMGITIREIYPAQWNQ